MKDPSVKPHDPYAAFRHRPYRVYFVLNFINVIGSQMVAAAVGWQIYAHTHQALALAMVGLAMAVPHYLLFLPAGDKVDRGDRRDIFLIAQCALLLSSLVLGWTNWRMEDPSRGLALGTYLTLTYGCLLVMGGSFAFLIPAKQSFFPLLVPHQAIPNAVTWNSTVFHVGTIAGPALAGLLLKFYPGGWVFLLDAGCSLVVLGLLLSLPRVRHDVEKKAATWETLLEGVRFVRDTPLILATITLDLFAVLFGGVMGILPMFATDILHGDSVTYGYLRAAPCLGAVVMAAFLAHRPLRDAGRTLLWAVAGFGVATIAFGLSKNLYLSIALMAILGGLDSISVILRATLVQVLTPHRLMGRVQAVNYLFITSSNELGTFESGAVAALFGPVLSAVSGGIGTLLVVAWVAKKWPQVAQLDRLERPEHIDARSRR